MLEAILQNYLKPPSIPSSLLNQSAQILTRKYHTLQTNNFNPTTKMSCNVVSNPSFEAGLNGWHARPLGVATIVTGDVAYDGSNLVSLATTPDVPSATVDQYLYDLDTANTYNLTVQVRIEGDLPSANQCTFSVEAGDDPAVGTIASDFVWNAGEWIELSGTYQPTVVDTVLNFVATCSFSGDVQLLNAYFDDVILSDC
ncbi:hypothetical protein BDW59DRAFT_154966 [Aspergillus cavernicola]|uniref:CBM-cenC domain-containing protein n=1 Tax=Aspergillus cavernicola TaxID=176166 RepID=A0ABR4HC64_9EURO